MRHLIATAAGHIDDPVDSIRGNHQAARWMECHRYTSVIYKPCRAARGGGEERENGSGKFR